MTSVSDDFEPHHASSPTDHVLAELQLYGFRPFDDEPDPRPLPEGNVVAGAIADIFDALIVTLQDTRLEPDLDDLLWSAVNLFHRATDRIERELDENEQAQRRGQRCGELSWAERLATGGPGPGRRSGRERGIDRRPRGVQQSRVHARASAIGPRARTGM